MSTYRLFSYWRSSCAFRVRIAMGLKGLTWETLPVHLLKGEQAEDGYTALNPSGLVPTLVLPDGRHLTQSLAIIDYLDASVPEPPLVPSDPFERAQVLAAALTIAADIQPVTNAGTVAHLRAAHGASGPQGVAWMVHWMERFLPAFQARIDQGSPFCFGASPGLADICLIPQLYNARRWGVDLAPLARLVEVEANCLALPAFANALPEAQPDAEV